MATSAEMAAGDRRGQGPGLTAAIDKWMFVGMALLLIAVTLTGFLPDSLDRIGKIDAGQRPPFPLVAHVHALATGGWMLLLLVQSTFGATGRMGSHRSLGRLAMVLGPLVVLAGIALSLTNYRMMLDMSHAKPPVLAKIMMDAQANTTALRIKHLTLFVVLVGIALRLRKSDLAAHKRLMVLAPLSLMAASISRITWLPKAMLANPVWLQTAVAVLVMPMLLWDLYRSGRVHRAYVIWLALYVPLSIAVVLLWDLPWWQGVVPHLMGTA